MKKILKHVQFGNQCTCSLSSRDAILFRLPKSMRFHRESTPRKSELPQAECCDAKFSFFDNLHLYHQVQMLPVESVV